MKYFQVISLTKLTISPQEWIFNRSMRATQTGRMRTAGSGGPRWGGKKLGTAAGGMETVERVAGGRED